MKKLLLSLSIAAFGLTASAQINMNTGDKVKRKVEDRVNRKVDQGIDKGLHIGVRRSEEDIDYIAGFLALAHATGAQSAPGSGAKSAANSRLP